MQRARYLVVVAAGLVAWGCSGGGGKSTDSGPTGPAADLASLDVATPDSAPVDGAATDAMDATLAPDGATVADVGSPPVTSTWIPITAGNFTMGSPATEPCRQGNEDLHKVTLTHGFQIWSTEVTQGQFQATMGYNPSQNVGCGPHCPVEMVRWHEAAAYCNALSALAGTTLCYSCTGTGNSVNCTEAAGYTDADFYDCPGYRLPTEAEFEYAHRAGTNTPYYSGANDGALCKDCATLDPNADAIAWYCANKGTLHTRPTGQKQPNGWGLYDMAGNVAEWTNDYRVLNLGTSDVVDPCRSTLTPNGRVLRGGSFARHADQLRPAYRYFGLPHSAFSDVGFRCVRSQ